MGVSRLSLRTEANSLLLLTGLLILFGLLELLLIRLLLGVEILASTAMLFILRYGARQPARVGLVAALGLLMLVTAAAPVDLALRRTGRAWVGVRPIAWGHVTKRGEASARVGDVVFAGDLVPLYPSRYAIVISW
jgi:hypothetical protein